PTAVNGPGAAVAHTDIDSTVCTRVPHCPEQAGGTAVAQLRGNQPHHIGTVDRIAGGRPAPVGREQSDVTGTAAAIGGVTVEIRPGEVHSRLEYTHRAEEGHDRTATLGVHPVGIELRSLFHPVGGTLTCQARIRAPADRFRVEMDIHQSIFDVLTCPQALDGCFQLLDAGGGKPQLTAAQQVDPAHYLATFGSGCCFGHGVQVRSFSNEYQDQIGRDLAVTLIVQQLILIGSHDGDRIADGEAQPVALNTSGAEKQRLVAGKTGGDDEGELIFVHTGWSDHLVTEHHLQVIEADAFALLLEAYPDGTARRPRGRIDRCRAQCRRRIAATAATLVILPAAATATAAQTAGQYD